MTSIMIAKLVTGGGKRSNSEVEGPHENIRIFVLEERKKGVQKQIGEVMLSVSGLEANKTVQNSYPIIGDKGATIGELRIRATYSVDIILPTVDYNELLSILIHPEMSVVKNLAAVTKEKSTTARHLIHIFQARDLAEGFIRNIVKEEIDRTDLAEVLFRGNTVCTKAMDHFMKLVGSLYQREVLMPIVEVICRETSSLEVQKEKLTNSDDWKKNLARLQKLTELLLQRIFNSVNHCPPPIRNLLAFIRETASNKFKNNPNVRHTAVTSFIFLRFFVPAVLNPKQFGLTANMPSELHMRIFTLVAGIMQKLANLTKYREQEVHINGLNPFLEENMPKTKVFIEEIVRVEPTANRMLQRKLSIANSIQMDIHVAGLVRELEACRAPLSGLITQDPHMALLFPALDRINTKLNIVKDQITDEEAGLSKLSTTAGSDGLDSLLSKVIQSEVQSSGNGNVVTVKRAEEPLPEGATKARQRSGSFFSKLFTGKRNVVSPSLKIPARGNTTTGEAKPRVPPSTPNSDFARSPLTQSLNNSDFSVTPVTTPSLTSSSGARSSTPSLGSSVPETRSLKLHSSDPRPSTQAPPPASIAIPMSSGSSPKRPLPPTPARRPGGTFEVGSAPSFPPPSIPVVNQNHDIITQHREAMRNRSSTGPTGVSKPLVSPMGAPPKFAPPPTPPPLASEAWFSDNSLISDLEAMEMQTDYYGTSSRLNRSGDSGDLSKSNYDRGNSILEEPEYTSDEGSISSPMNRSTESLPSMDLEGKTAYNNTIAPISEEDEEEPAELDEVVVVKLDIDVTQLEKEFEILEKIIADIQAVPPPPAPVHKSPSELIPEIRQMEKIVDALEEAVVYTTPKINTSGEGLTCKFCLGAIDTGSRFLVVMGQNFHEGHLNCHICSRDLSDVPFQWYKERSYCFDCYKKGHGIRPMCAHCNEPIMTATYTQALGKYWHPDHFVCTVCGVGFPDGSFYNFEGKPYCIKHQNRGKELPRCGMCNNPISDPNYIEALGQKWHSQHFCCDICGIQLLGQFVTYTKSNGTDGKACETHF